VKERFAERFRMGAATLTDRRLFAVGVVNAATIKGVAAMAANVKQIVVAFLTVGNPIPDYATFCVHCLLPMASPAMLQVPAAIRTNYRLKVFHFRSFDCPKESPNSTISV
jgi:hypothetical protein